MALFNQHVDAAKHRLTGEGGSGGNPLRESTSALPGQSDMDFDTDTSSQRPKGYHARTELLSSRYAAESTAKNDRHSFSASVSSSLRRPQRLSTGGGGERESWQLPTVERAPLLSREDMQTEFRR